MGFSLDVGVPALTVFLQGIISFFSPCVLPLLPLYIGYLSGGTGVQDDAGRMHYKKSKVLLNTLFFVIGISFAFFILGLGVSAAGTFFKGNQMLFARIGGVLIILFGLYQFGVFGNSEVLGKERRFHVNLKKLGMSPVTALVMGFTFSFAWTPCVGPALASVLVMSATAASQAAGFLLIGVYTLGFVLPFLAVGMFTTSLLELFKKHRNVVKYTVKVGAVLMTVMGLMLFTGKINAITGYLSQLTTAAPQVESEQREALETKESEAKVPDGTDAAGTQETEEKSEARELSPAIDFTLTDQYGETHTLADYKGKTVFLNFWATWCPPCRGEMPDIQKLYEEYQENGDDSVVMLGIAAPEYGREQFGEDVKAFLEENGYTYPVVMDEGGNFFEQYGVFSYPTTFMINEDGDVYGYISGQLTEDIMRSIIRQTQEGTGGEES